MIQASSATPTCPRCGHAVRSGVEIHRSLADLELLLNDIEPLRNSTNPADNDLHTAVCHLADAHLHQLSLELTGVHLDCNAPLLQDPFTLGTLLQAQACGACKSTLH